MRLNTDIQHIIKRKLATVLLVSASLAAFATLGDGGGKKGQKVNLSAKTFSLRTGYNYRSNNLFETPQRQYIQLNTVVTYQKGNSTFVMPFKKKMILGDKIKFNPAQ